MKLFNVIFKPRYPVGGCLVIWAATLEDATKEAKNLITWTSIEIEEIVLGNETQVIQFMSGEY